MPRVLDTNKQCTIMLSVPVGTTYVLRNKLGETAVVRGDSIVHGERRNVHAVGIENWRKTSANPM